MLRKIVKIDEDKCNGCGLCITGCHEKALELINGKAKLVAESYCDGLGACLPECPTGAITIEERESDAFDEEAVKERIATSSTQTKVPNLACGCPGTNANLITRENSANLPPAKIGTLQSELRQWPCQIQLVPVNAPYFDNAHLLIAADCAAYAYANIHSEFIRNKITLIGCPKLDNLDYAEKLCAILKSHEIKSITVLRMSVPCCGGLVHAVKQALANSGAIIPWRVAIISTDGKLIED